LPALNKARRAAATVQCASNMKQIASAVLHYSGDNKGRHILARVQASQVSTTYPNGWFWTNELVRLKYLAGPNQYIAGNSSIDRNSIFVCPEGIIDINSNSGVLVPQGALFPTDPKNRLMVKLATAIDTSITVPTWYQLNARLNKGPTGDTRLGGAFAGPFVNYNSTYAPPDPAFTDPGYTRTLSQIRKPAQVAMIFEGSEMNLLKTKDISARHGPLANDKKDAYTNIAFFDGHVSLYPTMPWTVQGDFTPVQNGVIVYLKDQK